MGGNSPLYSHVPEVPPSSFLIRRPPANNQINFMQQRITAVSIAFIMPILLGSSPQASGISFGLTPASVTCIEGTSVDLSLVVSGLGSSTAPSIGTYDINVLFDPNILSLSSVVFGDPVLGNQLDASGFGTISGVDASALGAVNLFELSLDDPGFLDTFQADSFTLATVTFNTIGTGVSSLRLTPNAIGDALGNPLALDISDGQVIVLSSQSHVPETADTGALLMMSMLALGIFKRKSYQRQ